MSTTRRYIACVALGMVLLYPLVAGHLNATPAAHAAKVLFISSYHPDFPTFFHQIDGIKSVFEPRSIVLDIEFMDSKRFNDASNLSNFAASLASKLQRLPTYDLILTGDDNALSFALERQATLFVGVPIIFFGINNIGFALNQNANPRVTGVVEAVSMLDTLRLIVNLQPDTRRFTALVDGTPSGQGDLKTFYSYRDQFRSHLFSDISLADLTFDEFAARLRQVTDDTSILLLSAFRDKGGKNLRFHESLDLILDNLARPIFHLWYHGMGDGILGGKLIHHFDQGAAAAKIALAIINGSPIENYPVTTESPNRYIFDYPVMIKFGIDEDILPHGSSVINRPVSFYEAHKKVLSITLLIIASLFTMIVILVFNILKRERAEKELKQYRDHLESLVQDRTADLTETNKALKDSEERYHSLSDASFEGIVITEKEIILEVNDRFYQMVGYTPADIIGRSFYNLLPVEERDRVKGQLRSGLERIFESRYLHRDGSTISVEIQSRKFPFKGKQVSVTAIRDISERKRSEEEIQQLRGILPLCSYCKKVRDDKGYWEQVDVYINKYSAADISHSVCPDCMKVQYQKVLSSMHNPKVSKDP